MIVKFHARGVGRGSGPVDYLLGRDRERDGAQLLSGEPDLIIALCDSSPYAKKYTSGVLSFEEEDLPKAQKDILMSSFEKTLLPGLDKNQYACLWVEHKDKGRLELNFLIPNVELQTGKRLQPYFDKADKPRVNAWKVMVNAKYQLHDPDDPKNHRTLVTANNLPKEKQAIAQTITDSLLHLAGHGQINSREDVLNLLNEGGFSVVRKTTKSISIADPDGGRNIRLKGAIYEQNFRFGNELREEIEGASQRYRDGANVRFQTAHAVYQKGIDAKRAFNLKRYKREPTPNRESLQNDLVPTVYSDGDHHRDFDDVQSLRVGQYPEATGHEATTRNNERVLERQDRPTANNGEELNQTDKAEREQHQKIKGSRFGIEISTMRETLVLADGEIPIRKLDEAKRQSSDVHTRRILDDDGIRNSIIESIRDITDRARETAQGLRDGLRTFIKDVQKYFDYEQDSAESVRNTIEADRNLAKASNGIGEIIRAEKEVENKGKELDFDIDF